MVLCNLKKTPSTVYTYIVIIIVSTILSTILYYTIMYNTISTASNQITGHSIVSCHKSGTVTNSEVSVLIYLLDLVAETGALQ